MSLYAGIFPYIILDSRNAHPDSDKTPDRPEAPEHRCSFASFGRTPQRGWEAERCRWWQRSPRTPCHQRSTAFSYPGSHKNPRAAAAWAAWSRNPLGWPPGMPAVARKSEKSVPRGAASRANAVMYYKQQAFSCRSSLAEELYFTGITPSQIPSGSAGGQKGCKRAMLLIHLSLCWK